MSPDNFKDECHVLAEHVMRLPSNSEDLTWLKKEVCSFLLSSDSIKGLSSKRKAESRFQTA